MIVRFFCLLNEKSYLSATFKDNLRMNINRCFVLQFFLLFKCCNDVRPLLGEKAYCQYIKWRVFHISYFTSRIVFAPRKLTPKIKTVEHEYSSEMSILCLKAMKTVMTCFHIEINKIVAHNNLQLCFRLFPICRVSSNYIHCSFLNNYGWINIFGDHWHIGKYWRAKDKNWKNCCLMLRNVRYYKQIFGVVNTEVGIIGIFSVFL